MMTLMNGSKLEGLKKLNVDNRIISNKVVLCAIKNLVGYINLSTGISHSSDKKITIDTFKILKKNNEEINFIEIKSWLVLKVKIKPKFAEDIISVGRKILNGKSIHSTEKLMMYKSNVINRWREEAKDEKYISE